MLPDIQPEAPDGFEGLIQVLNWLGWVAIVCCLAGFIFSAIKLGMAYRDGTMEGVKGLVLALVGCILIGSAAGIFNAVTAF